MARNPLPNKIDPINYKLTGLLESVEYDSRSTHVVAQEQFHQVLVALVKQVEGIICVHRLKC